MRCADRRESVRSPSSGPSTDTLRLERVDGSLRARKDLLVSELANVTAQMRVVKELIAYKKRTRGAGGTE